MYPFVFFPFEGFYHSRHDDEIDITFESLWGEDHEENRLEELFHQIDWKTVHRLYAIDFTDCIQQYLNDEREIYLPSLAFNQLESPREYNFTTDKLILSMDSLDWRYLCEKFNEERMTTLLLAFFTPRDGFIPFYSADLSDWIEPHRRKTTDDLLQWVLHKADAVQRGVFFLACFEEDITDEQVLEERGGMEPMHEKITNMLEEALTEEGERILDEMDSQNDDS